MDKQQLYTKITKTFRAFLRERERERVKSLRDFDLNFTKPFTQSAVFCGAFCLPRSSAEGGYFRVFSK